MGSPVGEEEPLRLALAAELAFPRGGMTASGLRREAERGRLVIERIAGKDYTTLRAIADMRKLCRVEPKARDCTLSPQGGETARPSARRRGSSEMGQSSEALERARAKLLKLRNSL